MMRYSRTAMTLHWLIAALLVYNYALGERTEQLSRGPELFAIFQFHKSIGITILLLSLARLAMKLARPRPAIVSDDRVANSCRSQFIPCVKGSRATTQQNATLARGTYGVGTGQFEGDDTIGTSVAVNFRFDATRQ